MNELNGVFAVGLCIPPLDFALLSTNKLCLDAVRRILFAYRAGVGICVGTEIGTMADSLGMEHTSSISDPLWDPSRILQ